MQVVRAAGAMLAAAWVSSAAAARAQEALPEWAAGAFQDSRFAGTYSRSDRLDPSFLPGDFDGDGRPDVAVLVTRRDTQALGIAFLHAGSMRPIVVGAGQAIGNGGDDFSWMDAWSVRPKGPGQRGDALLVEKRESASALLSWDGKAYRWHQQGD